MIMISAPRPQCGNRVPERDAGNFSRADKVTRSAREGRVKIFYHQLSAKRRRARNFESAA